MTNIILQHYTGTLGELEEKSIKSISKYATKIGVEYKFLEGNLFRDDLPAQSQKLFMLNDTLDIYDTVIMVDIDKFTTVNTNQNVFEALGIGLYADTQQNLHKRIASEHSRIASINFPYWGGAIYKLSLNDRKTLRAGLGSNEEWMKKFNHNFHDEGIMHVLATKTQFKPKHPYFSDRRWCYCSYRPKPETAQFIHIRPKNINGSKKPKLENYKELVQKGIILE